jgi:hypothetical protein
VFHCCRHLLCNKTTKKGAGRHFFCKKAIEKFDGSCHLLLLCDNGNNKEGDDFCASKKKGDNNKAIVTFFVTATPKQKVMAVLLPLLSTLYPNVEL